MREVMPRRCARCNPSMRVAGMTSMMPSVASRVTTMPARVTTSMPSSSGLPSSACKYRRRTEDKDYADA
jgi:hypothetical protein